MTDVARIKRITDKLAVLACLSDNTPIVILMDVMNLPSWATDEELERKLDEELRLVGVIPDGVDQKAGMNLEGVAELQRLAIQHRRTT